MGQKTCESNENSQSVCRNDRDCDVLQADCCGCLKGGKQIAILKAEKSSQLEKITSKCAGLICPQFISTDSSCKGLPKCINGQCQLQ